MNSHPCVLIGRRLLLGATILCGAVATANDPFTAALWLFDEEPYHYSTLADGSPHARADLCLMEGGRLEEGKYGRALVAGAQKGFHVAYAGFTGGLTGRALREKDGMPSGLWGPTEGPTELLGALASPEWTLEFWLGMQATGQEAVVLDLGQGTAPGVTLSISGDAFTLRNSYAGSMATLPAANRGPADEWAHHAFVIRGHEVFYYRNGRQTARARLESIPKVAVPDPQRPVNRSTESRGFERMDPAQRRSDRFNVALGEDRTGARKLSARIDELRFSNGPRYRGDFSPPDTFSRGLMAPRARRTGPAPLFAGATDRAIAFGARKHVFIDDALLDQKSGVTLTMNRPTGKTRTNLVPERSAWRPSVFDRDGKVFMLIPESYSSATGNNHLATSADGVNFELERDIITGMSMYSEAFQDTNPDALPAERFKMTGYIGNRGVFLFTSPDGRRWRRNDTTMLPIRSGGSAETYFDDQRGKYVSVLRRDSSYDGVGDSKGPSHGRRCVQFESDNIFGAWPFRKLQNPYFESWPFPALTNEGENIFLPTPLGQVYRTRAIKYPWAPDMYVCFIWRFPPDTEARQVELGTSRDGHNWRYWGPWYIDKGDREEALSLYGLIRRGDEIWQYSDHGDAHGGSSPRDYYRWTQRLDGFVSLDAAGKGVATTKPILISGERLELNATVRGALRVAILGEDDQPLAGFTLADCQRISGDSVRHEVAWKPRSALGALGGRPVRLHFEMENAKLFAFELK